MKNYNLGIIGCGNMSQAIIKSVSDDTNAYLLKQNGYKINIYVSDTDESKLQCIKDLNKKNIFVYTDNEKIINAAEFIIFAIKPQTAQEVMSKLDFNGKTLISIMAGLNCDTLKKYSNNSTDKIVRVMPNLNARIGNSYNAYTPNGLNEDEIDFVDCILNSFGEAHIVQEEMMDAVTGVTGSGPAFVFMFIKAFVDAAKSNGFDAVTARQMALATIIGSAYLVESEENKSIEELIESVCSKGGTTIEGVNYLTENKMPQIVKDAIQKSILRAGELNKTI